LLLALEGADGCGKSTQVRLLTHKLRDLGLDAHAVSFPRYEDPVFGDLIRRFLAGELGPVEDVHPRLVALLFAGDRGAESENLRRLQAEGKVLICDRYFYSNLAYQGAKLDRDEFASFERWLRALEIEHNAIPMPVCSLYLDVPRKHREARLAARVASGASASKGAVPDDIHERDLALQARVEEIFRDLSARGDDLVRVDCERDGAALGPEEVHDAILSAIRATGAMPSV
jgi:dTMP kinase